MTRLALHAFALTVVTLATVHAAHADLEQDIIDLSAAAGIDPDLGARIYCIERIESHHGLAMYNPMPVWDGEHAQGWLGWLPSTAAHWGVQIGDRISEWIGASAILALGNRFAGTQFYGVGAGLC